jgi:hypothetical protein
MKTKYPKRLSSLLLAIVIGALFACAPVIAADMPSEPDARLKEARALVEQGKQEEALQQFVWCYDHGTEANAKFARTRDTRVTVAMASLGEKYPPALAALAERRDALAKIVKNAPKKADEVLVRQLAYLDLALGDDAVIIETLALFPPGKAGHKTYGSVVQERLVETKHYREAVSIEEVGDVVGMLEKMADQAAAMRQSGRLDGKGEAKLKGIVLKAVPGVEMYAGSGDLKHANRIAELLVSICDAPEVRQKLAERFRRAGTEELAAKYDPQK